MINGERVVKDLRLEAWSMMSMQRTHMAKKMIVQLPSGEVMLRLLASEGVGDDIAFSVVCLLVAF